VGRDIRHYERLSIYLRDQRVDGTGRFNPPGTLVKPRTKTTPPVYVLLLLTGLEVMVCVDENDRVHWFDVQVTGLGLVHIVSETRLIGPIAEKVDQFFDNNGL